MRCLELSRREETLEVYMDVFFGPSSWLIMRIESSKEGLGGHSGPGIRQAGRQARWVWPEVCSKRHSSFGM